MSIHKEHLSAPEYIAALKQKLAEEVDELFDARDKEEILEECADIWEVFQTLTQVLGFSQEQLEESVARKKKEKGGFCEPYKVISVTVPSETGIYEPYIQHFRKHPEKYPELPE